MGRSRFDATGAPDQHASQAGPLQAGAAGSGSGQVGARKFRGEVSLRPPSKEGVGTVAFSVAFILTLRRKVISVIVTRFDNICNNFIRLTQLNTSTDFRVSCTHWHAPGPLRLPHWLRSDTPKQGSGARDTLNSQADGTRSSISTTKPPVHGSGF